LAACAGAVLLAPSAFWTALPNAAPEKLRLDSALKRLRNAESRLIAGMQTRLNLLVRRQALDLQCWDFIAAGRSRLREILSPNSSEWERFGFEGAQNRIPARFRGRLTALHALTRHLAKRQDQKSAQYCFTIENGRRIRKAIRTITSEGRQARAEIMTAVRSIRQASKEISDTLHSVRSLVWTGLLRGDRRWIAAGCPLIPSPALQRNPANTSGQSPDNDPASRLTQPSTANHDMDRMTLPISTEQTGVSGAGLAPAVPAQAKTPELFPHALEKLSIHSALRLLFPDPT
jgi:hypothetical protein